MRRIALAGTRKQTRTHPRLPLTSPYLPISTRTDHVHCQLAVALERTRRASGEFAPAGPSRRRRRHRRRRRRRARGEFLPFIFVWAHGQLDD